jgi:hypothetical protein
MTIANKFFENVMKIKIFLNNRNNPKFHSHIVIMRLLSYVSGKIVPFVELTVAHASVLTILAISFERYYAICEPLKASYVCTKARALTICLLAWLFAALFTRFVFLFGSLILSGIG